MYIGLLTLLHVPAFQEYVGEKLSSYLSTYLDTKVEIGSVEMGLLNQSTLNDVRIYDREGRVMLKADKASARVELLSFLSDEISLSTVNLYGFQAKLVKPSPSSELNIQFLIDKLKGEEKEEAKSPRIRLSNLIIRNGEIAYDDLSTPPLEGQRLDKNHIYLSPFNLDISLTNLAQDSLDIDINEIDFTETRSNLSLKSFTARITSDKDKFMLHNPALYLSDSFIHSNLVQISKSPTQVSSISGDIYDTQIHPKDFAQFASPLSNLSSPISISTEFQYTDKTLILKNLLLSTSDDALAVDGDFEINKLASPDISFEAKCRDLSIESEKSVPYLRLLKMDESSINRLSQLGQIKIKGVASYLHDGTDINTIIETGVGNLQINGHYDNQNLVNAQITSSSLMISKILPETGIAKLSMDMNIDANISKNSPSGTLSGEISHIEYKDYHLDNIKLDGQLSQDGYTGSLTVRDQQIDFTFDGKLTGVQTPPYHLDASISAQHFRPSSLGLKGKNAEYTYDFSATAKMDGTSIDDVTGSIQLNNIKIQTPTSAYAFNDVQIDVPQNSITQKEIAIKSDICDISLIGKMDFNTLLSSLRKIPNAVVPQFNGDASANTKGDAIFQFNATINDHPYLHTFIPYPYQFKSPLTVGGHIDTEKNKYDLHLQSESLTYDKTTINDINLNYTSDHNVYQLSATGSYPKEEKSYDAHLNLSGKGQEFSSDIALSIAQENPITGKFKINGRYDMVENRPKFRLHMDPSLIKMSERLLNVQAEEIAIEKDHLSLKELKLENEGKYLTVNGVLSDDSTHCLTADLNGSPIGSIFEILNAKAKNIDGYVYGKCNVYNILSTPKVDANLTVQDFQFKDYIIGNAYISANWDNQEKGIRLRTQVIGADYASENRHAQIDGYIYLAKEELELNSKFRNIDAILLEKLIGRTIKSIRGKVNADVGIRGPFNDIQIIGSGTADATLTLRATNVGYTVSPEDPIGITTNSFLFNNIHISDKAGHKNILNGKVGHEGFKNFSYTFDMNMDDLLVYEETAYNKDKFKGTIYADGVFHLDGSDGHPLQINADITPAAGSEFCYDAATPDAITGSNFLLFQEKEPSDSLLISLNIDPGWYWNKKNPLYEDDDDAPKKPYRGDIFMDIGIRMNHNCPVKLRMDNVEDGYITTYGTGFLQAEYHNKGSFSLNGTYKIDNGKYRLYLQDIIYRDLVLQNGSQVVFNGNPFDADINLICWYTLNSVPLSDLTSVAYTQNNRIKVICELGITGKLGNMAFNFDLNLPNVSDETRQIVRSYISTEEEMNKQMIYLLGFGRFFTNEYARVNGDTNTNQAVNNLLSSTLSGQLNQMLTNAMGNESKWNIGTGLSTGERGWEDMDVEGNLSGRLLDDRLLINGNFGYRDNSMTNTSSFIGDVDVKWRLTPNGNTYLKAYNLTNDRYFTKSTLNTQGIGATYQKDFESWKDLFKRKRKSPSKSTSLSNEREKTPSIDSRDTTLLFFRQDTLH